MIVMIKVGFVCKLLNTIELLLPFVIPDETFDQIQEIDKFYKSNECELDFGGLLSPTDVLRIDFNTIEVIHVALPNINVYFSGTIIL